MSPIDQRTQTIEVKIKTTHPLFEKLSELFPSNFSVSTEVFTEILDTELVYGIGVDTSMLQEVLKVLNYIPISQRRSAELSPNSIELHLGSLSINEYNITVKTNTSKFLQEIQSTFGSVLVDSGGAINHQLTNCIQYGGANEVLVRLLAINCQLLTGQEVTLAKAWGDDDKDIWINIEDPSTIGRPLRSWMPLVVNCDDVDLGRQLVDTLKGFGFERARTMTEGEFHSHHPGFYFEPNSFQVSKNKRRRRNSLAKSADVLDVQSAVQSFLKINDVDHNQFPLDISQDEEGDVGVLHIPIRKFKQGGIMPYGGTFPGAYPIHIRTDDLSLAEGLSEILRNRGFTVTTAFIQSTELLNPCLDWGEFMNHPMAKDLTDCIDGYLSQNGLPSLLPPVVRKADSKYINIDLPRLANFPLSLANYKAVSRSFTVSVNIERSNPHYLSIEEKLRSLGVRRVRTRRGRGPGDNVIHFGGAPTALISEILSIAQPWMGADIEMNQYWGDDDTDVYIFFPELDTNIAPNEEVFDIERWLSTAFLEVGVPFVQTTKKTVQIGGVILDLADRFDHPRTPTNTDFKHYCIDSKTAQLLERVGEAVLGNECLLLEGSTATSKTSSILYLAAQLGQPVMRLNLSGATDVSEFVGRFVPDENRSGNGWRWEDGPVVKAMTEGYWLILDELNLAEASILERLNSILERKPTLLLSEYNDRLIGGLENPVHPSFRVFGTQNPEHYAGRNALSPAYRDRFHETHVENPNLDANAMEEMLHWLVFGRTPNIQVNGLQYAGLPTSIESPLSTIPRMELFLKSVAIFHASLCTACTSEKGGVPKIGADRMGGYSFTRRGLLRLVDHLERNYREDMKPTEINRMLRLALVRTYLERVDISDRMQVVNLLNAAGIGPETWVV